MDLRQQLDAAHRRIADLEKQLEMYRKGDRLSNLGLTSNSSAETTVYKRSVITRAAAAALKQIKASDPSMSESPSRRPKHPSSKKLAPNALVSQCPALQPQSVSIQLHQDANQSVESISFDPASANPAPAAPTKMDFARSKSLPKALRPATSVIHQRFSPSPTSAVPLKPKLAIDKAKRSSMQTLPKFATNILSPVSAFSDQNAASSNPKKTALSKPAGASTQPTATGPSGKTSKKERSTIVAKCTEPRQGQTRYWTQEEHERFLEAVAQYGEKAYVAISNYVETRTPKQVRTHAQKFQMKMARLARQSAENGEALELPPGMLPINVECAPKKKVATSPMSDSTGPDDAAAAGCRSESGREEIASSASDGAGTGSESVDVASEDCAISDLVAEAASSVSDVSCDNLADPYLTYIGGDADGHEDGVLEDCFAVKLSKTFQPSEIGLTVKHEMLALSEEGSMQSGRLEHDDDLEDLEDCGELPMASLSNFGI